MAVWLSPFAMDLRSLALFRVLTATTILYVLWDYARSADVLLTDHGMLPRVMFTGTWLHVDPEKNPLLPPGVYMMDGTLMGAYVLLAVHAIVNVCMLVGYETRLSCFLNYVLYLGLTSVRTAPTRNRHTHTKTITRREGDWRSGKFMPPNIFLVFAYFVVVSFF